MSLADEKKSISILKRLHLPKVGKARWIALAVLVGFIAIRAIDPLPLQTVRVKTFDLFQQLEPREIIPDSPVVIIDLDEASLKEVGQWPWPRNLLAKMTLNLFKMGVRVVGFDVIFAEPDRMNSESVVTSLNGLDEETKKKILKLPSNNFW
jgi:adenylate cyclase